MGNFQDIFGNFAFVALMILAGIAFIIISQTANDAAQPIVGNQILNSTYSDLQDSLSSLESTSQVQYGQFTEETPQSGFTSIVLFGIVSAGKTFSTVVLSTFVLIVELPTLVLGLPQTLFATLASWMVISLIVAAWILYKIGG